jgi:hypothetical protein
MISNIKDLCIDWPSRTIFPSTSPQPIMHPDNYEIMANYFSDDFEDQIRFLKLMSDLDNEPFLPLIKDISFLSITITDKQWLAWHGNLGLTQTPRTLRITHFTNTIWGLKQLLLLTPYLKTIIIPSNIWGFWHNLAPSNIWGFWYNLDFSLFTNLNISTVIIEHIQSNQTFKRNENNIFVAID